MHRSIATHNKTLMEEIKTELLKTPGNTHTEGEIKGLLSAILYSCKFDRVVIELQLPYEESMKLSGGSGWLTRKKTHKN